jgi:hypothetical protein
MRSTRDEALSRLKSVTGTHVLATLESPDGTFSFILDGLLSMSEDGFKVSGAGNSMLVFDPEFVKSCEAPEQQVTLPARMATVLDMKTGVPFLTVHLENGIQIAFQHFTSE